MKERNLPHEGDVYFYIDSGSVHQDRFSYFDIKANDHLETGNYFLTRTAAFIYALRLYTSSIIDTKEL